MFKNVVNNYWSALTCFIVAVVLIIAGIVWARSFVFSDAKNETDCALKNLSGICTSIWDSGVCRKAETITGGCKTKGSAGPMVLLVIGAILLLAALVWAIVIKVKYRSSKDLPGIV